MSPNNDPGSAVTVKPDATASSASDFLIVTERGGEPVSSAQLERFLQRYVWAAVHSAGKDVLELACGTGPGLGYLAGHCRSLQAGDLDPEVLSLARAHYGSRLQLGQYDAVATPFPDATFDVVILFEAIYYLPDARKFVSEVGRILRPGGCLLLATANKDLFDFNPSPFSSQYFNPPELSALLREGGFSVSFFGGSPIRASGPASAVLRRVKRIAVALNLIPRSMRAKRILKRLVFGRLVTMPIELRGNEVPYVEPVPVRADLPDMIHQVIYCIAVKDSP